MVRERLATPAL